MDNKKRNPAKPLAEDCIGICWGAGEEMYFSVYKLKFKKIKTIFKGKSCTEEVYVYEGVDEDGKVISVYCIENAFRPIDYFFKTQYEAKKFMDKYIDDMVNSFGSDIGYHKEEIERHKQGLSKFLDLKGLVHKKLDTSDSPFYAVDLGSEDDIEE